MRRAEKRVHLAELEGLVNKIGWGGNRVKLYMIIEVQGFVVEPAREDHEQS